MRELEEEHLAPEVRIISRGAEFATGNAVTLRVGGRGQEHRMSTMSRHFPIITSSYALITVIAILYVILLIVSAG
jgi:hypothetical protein